MPLFQLGRGDKYILKLYLTKVRIHAVRFNIFNFWCIFVYRYDDMKYDMRTCTVSSSYTAQVLCRLQIYVFFVLWNVSIVVLRYLRRMRTDVLRKCQMVQLKGVGGGGTT